MLDLIGTVFATAYCAALVGIPIAMAPAAAAARLAGLVAATAWLSMVVAAAALGAMVPGALGPVPGPILSFLGLVALLFGGWIFAPRFRQALLAVPLPALVAANIARLGGIFFLLLWWDGRLSAPFAPSAGLGDMITGAFALLLAALLALGVEVRRIWLVLWNAFGAVDLFLAIALGALSAPGTPFRLFHDGPGTEVMATLPWILVPTMIVPILLLTHVAIAAKLRASSRTTQAIAAVR